MFEQDTSYVANQNLFISLFLNCLYAINHAYVIAHLERSLCKFQIHVLESLFTYYLEKL